MIKETTHCTVIGGKKKANGEVVGGRKACIQVCNRIGAEDADSRLVLSYFAGDPNINPERETKLVRHEYVYAVERAGDGCGCCTSYRLHWVSGNKVQARQREMKAIRYPHDPHALYLVDARGEVDAMGPIVLDDTDGPLVAYYDRGDSLPAPTGQKIQQVLARGTFKGCLAQARVTAARTMLDMAANYEKGTHCRCADNPFKNTTGRARTASRKKK